MLSWLPKGFQNKRQISVKKGLLDKPPKSYTSGGKIACFEVIQMISLKTKKKKKRFLNALKILIIEKMQFD